MISIFSKLYEDGFNPFIAAGIPKTIKSEITSKILHPIQKAIVAYLLECNKIIRPGPDKIFFRSLKLRQMSEQTDQLEFALNSFFLVLNKKSEPFKKGASFTRWVELSKSYVQGNFIIVVYQSNVKYTNDSGHIICTLSDISANIVNSKGDKETKPYSSFDATYLELINKI
jgi:hypothetical protein